MGIKDEELEGLSDEERAALEDDDDESEILKGIAGDDDEDDSKSQDDGKGDDSDDDDDSADDDGAKSAANADDTDNADSARAGTASDEEPVTIREFQPELVSTAPADLTEKLADIDTRTKDLVAKFKDGDIDLPDFLEQKGVLDAEKLDLTVKAEQAKFATQQNESSREQRWKWEQERFFGQKTAEIYKDPIVLAALNASVVQLSNAPANAKRPAAWFLEEADRQVRSRFNFGDAEKPGGDKAKDKAKERQPDLSKLPKTLTNLPAADVSETGGEEFAYLDKLDGIALEAALRKMTPEQEARYLGATA